MFSIAQETGVNYSSIRTVFQKYREGGGRINRLLNFNSKKSILKQMSKVPARPCLATSAQHSSKRIKKHFESDNFDQVLRRDRGWHETSGFHLKVESYDESLETFCEENQIELPLASSIRAITYQEKAELEASIADSQRHIIGWNNFGKIDVNVERLAFPLAIGDDYDTGKMNEVISQTQVFHGALECMNWQQCHEQRRQPGNLELPKPATLALQRAASI